MNKNTNISYINTNISIVYSYTWVCDINVRLYERDLRYLFRIYEQRDLNS